jgi:hypothetical protein
MPDEDGAAARFQKVLDDETRMSTVFEEFLRNFFQLHRNEYRVRAESPEWNCVGHDAPSPGALWQVPAGRRTVNTEPLPASLVTVTSPPIMRASLRVMARPRPVPP